MHKKDTYVPRNITRSEIHPRKRIELISLVQHFYYFLSIERQHSRDVLF